MGKQDDAASDDAVVFSPEVVGRLFVELRNKLDAVEARLKDIEAREDVREATKLNMAETTEKIRAVLDVLVDDKPLEFQELKAQHFLSLRKSEAVARMSAAEATYKARVALAAKRSGFVAEDGRADITRWLEWCEKTGWDRARKAPPEQRRKKR